MDYALTATATSKGRWSRFVKVKEGAQLGEEGSGDGEAEQPGEEGEDQGREMATTVAAEATAKVVVSIASDTEAITTKETTTPPYAWARVCPRADGSSRHLHRRLHRDGQLGFFDKTAREAVSVRINLILACERLPARTRLQPDRQVLPLHVAGNGRSCVDRPGDATARPQCYTFCR